MVQRGVADKTRAVHRTASTTDYHLANASLEDTACTGGTQEWFSGDSFPGASYSPVLEWTGAAEARAAALFSSAAGSNGAIS